MNPLKPEAITLSVYDSALSTFAVCWQTAEYGSPVLQYTDEEDSCFTRATEVDGICSEGMGSVKNSALFENPDRSRKYLFRVGDKSGVFSEPAVCRFPSLDENKLKFIVITDTQDEEHHGEWFRYPSLDAKKLHGDAELIIHTGDMVQEGGNAEMWRLMLENTREYFLSMPMAPLSGNHDYWEWYLHGYTNILDRHYHIDYPPQNTKNGIYYSFDCGPAHFTVISTGDSMETDKNGVLPSQLEWV
ncbi:MAG: metallophosphoesterase family protein, partial [Clostridia bacterium]|nr:metallophosphoesterase family protein [Clostridia bacterium]